MIETEIRLATTAMRGDADRAEEIVRDLKNRIERYEMKLAVVLSEKEVRESLDRLLTELQRRADERPIKVPVQLRDQTGGGSAAPSTSSDGGGEAGDAAAAGAAGAGAGSASGAMRGLGRIGAAYAIARAMTSVLRVANSLGDQFAAKRRGDLDAEVKAIESIRQAAGEIPLAGPMGLQLNRLFFTGKEEDRLAQTKQETEELDKHTKIMEHRNELMRKSIDHSKELVKQAELEAAALVRPEYRAMVGARQKLDAFDTAMDARMQGVGRRGAAGTGLVPEEQAARTALVRNFAEAQKTFDAAVLRESNKQIEEGGKSLQKWRNEVEKWNKEAELATENERKRREGIADARFGTNQARLRAGGMNDDADIAEIGRSFDKRIAAAKDYDTQQALTEEKNARLQEEYGKQQADRTREVADEWERAADAADAAARNILDTQRMQSDVDELRARNRGQGAVGDFIRLRQHVRDIYAGAGDDPAKQELARQMGLEMIQQFIQGSQQRVGGGIFGGGVDFARNMQQAIMGGQGDGSRAMAINFASAFAAELGKGGNPFGEAAGKIADAAKAFEDAAKRMQPIGVVKR